MKYRIYIDEVGNSDLKSSADVNHRFLCLTGIVFDLNYVAEIVQPQLEELKTKYFNSHPDDPVVLHRKELVQKKYPFNSLSDPEIEASFNAEFIQLLSSWNYKVIASIIDKHEHNTNYAATWKHDPYHYCQETLLERYRLFLDMYDSNGDVMIESRGGKEDMRLKKSFRNLLDNGTRFLSSSQLQERLTSKELKVKSKGSNIAGLQLADVIAHAVRRYAFKTIWNNDDGKFTFSDKIIEILVADKFFRYGNKIYGYGLKKLP